MVFYLNLLNIEMSWNIHRGDLLFRLTSKKDKLTINNWVNFTTDFLHL